MRAASLPSFLDDNKIAYTHSRSLDDLYTYQTHQTTEADHGTSHTHSVQSIVVDQEASRTHSIQLTDDDPKETNISKQAWLALPLFGGNLSTEFIDLIDGHKELKGKLLGLIPNNEITFWILSLSFLGAEAGFDGINTVKGADDLWIFYKERRLSTSLSEELQGVCLSHCAHNAAIVLSCCIIIPGAMAAMLENINNADLAEWPPSLIAPIVVLGAGGYLLTEGKAIATTLAKCIGHIQNDHHPLSKWLSLPIKTAGSLGVSLFNYSAINELLPFTTFTQKISLMFFLSLTRGIADFIYSGNLTTDSIEIMRKKIMSICYPAQERLNATECVIGGISLFLGIMLADLQSGLIKREFDEIAIPYQNIEDFLKKNVLNIIAMLWTVQLAINYSSAISHPIGYLLHKAISAAQYCISALIHFCCQETEAIHSPRTSLARNRSTLFQLLERPAQPLLLDIPPEEKGEEQQPAARNQRPYQSI